MFLHPNDTLGVYIARPYNFHLNPLPDKKLNVERDFSFQSGGKTSHNVKKQSADLPSCGLPS